MSVNKKKIAILGGGPSGLFVFKNLIESGRSDFAISIYDAKNSLGAGMPYHQEGANHEHVTNVSGNEIPELVTSLEQWLSTVPATLLEEFGIDLARFNEYKVIPRLLFGYFLAAQFDLLLQRAIEVGITARVYFNSKVADITDHPQNNAVSIQLADGDSFEFDHVIVCTGHTWPKTSEGVVPGYFDSPYPPAKLPNQLNHAVAITGASLTAIDAIRTMARHHGTFIREHAHKVSYAPNENAPDFKIIMHSRHGLLPGIRFHLDDPHISKESILSQEEIAANRNENNGFLSLDFVFENDFKKALITKDPALYARIKDMSMEEFVTSIMDERESKEPFLLFREEYAEAEKSIRREQSVHWKEMLAALSFAMNYPAKHLSAEDMMRLQKVLMPLISIVIAFVPQSSCEELLALHEAGRLELVAVGAESTVQPHMEGGVIYHYQDQSGSDQSIRYETYINCIGQSHLSLQEFPFRSLVEKGSVSQARLKFRSHAKAAEWLAEGNDKIEKSHNEDYFLKVAGLTINDQFQAVDAEGKASKRIYLMAVPYIGGYNPDYSGLDFCEAASRIIVNALTSGS